jgi:hypothetical protein
MMRSILALAVVVAAGTSLAGAVELEQAAAQASAMTATSKAAISGPCQQTPKLEAASFVVRFPAGAPQGSVSEYTVHFGNCEVEDYYYGEPIEPRAIRRYFSEDKRFGLVLTTEGGADRSSIELSAMRNGFSQLTAFVGDAKNRDLIATALSFTAVQAMDVDGVGGVMRPRDVSISPVAKP